MNMDIKPRITGEMINARFPYGDIRNRCAFIRSMREFYEQASVNSLAQENQLWGEMTKDETQDVLEFLASP